MTENDEGRMDYVRRRFAEAQNPEDVDRIRQELIADEDIPRGTARPGEERDEEKRRPAAVQCRRFPRIIKASVSPENGAL